MTRSYNRRNGCEQMLRSRNTVATLATSYVQVSRFLDEPEYARAISSPRDNDGACLQMRQSFSPVVDLFFFLFPWMDCRIAGALGLLRIFIYMVSQGVGMGEVRAAFLNGLTIIDELIKKGNSDEVYMGGRMMLSSKLTNSKDGATP